MEEDTEIPYIDQFFYLSTDLLSHLQDFLIATANTPVERNGPNISWLFVSPIPRD